jgi:DNA-directed RNA polymerase
MANSQNWIFSEIVGILDKQIQRARCEEFLINIADAFDGYELWFPAFVDFRGRIYRTGFQHFHERDLARSLILFSSQYTGLDNHVKRVSRDREVNQETLNILASATYAHYQTPVSLKSSYEWVLNNCDIRDGSKENVPHTELLNLAASAKNPFLFIASVLRFKRVLLSGDIKALDEIPVSMDASSSAYQIMSFLLLDEDFARRTNLIGGDGDTILDLYTSLIDPLASFLKENLNEPLGEVVAEKLSRKLIKSVYMPFLGLRSILLVSKEGSFRNNLV